MKKWKFYTNEKYPIDKFKNDDIKGCKPSLFKYKVRKLVTNPLDPKY